MRIGRGGEAKSIPTGLKKERDRCKFGAHFFFVEVELRPREAAGGGLWYALIFFFEVGGEALISCWKNRERLFGILVFFWSLGGIAWCRSYFSFLDCCFLGWELAVGAAGTGRRGESWKGECWGGLLDWWGMFVVATYVDLPS